jgi:hypothetical protein
MRFTVLFTLLVVIPGSIIHAPAAPPPPPLPFPAPPGESSLWGQIWTDYGLDQVAAKIFKKFLFVIINNISNYFYNFKNQISKFQNPKHTYNISESELTELPESIHLDQFKFMREFNFNFYYFKNSKFIDNLILTKTPTASAVVYTRLIAELDDGSSGEAGELNFSNVGFYYRIENIQLNKIFFNLKSFKKLKLVQINFENDKIVKIVEINSNIVQNNSPDLIVV